MDLFGLVGASGSVLPSLFWTQSPFRSAYTRVMTVSAAEFFEAGLSLPPAVRKEVALRLLESVEVVDDAAVEAAWASEITSRVDDILTGKVQTISGDEVFARIDQRLAASEVTPNA